MRAEYGQSLLPKGSLFGSGSQQVEKDFRDGAGLRDSQGIALSEPFHDIAKVFRKRAHHDRLGKPRRLEDVVAAARNQTAADKGYGCQGVERSQLANAVEQEYRAR